MLVEFTGAQLLKGSDIVEDYIQHWHNGRSFFEFVPQEGAQFSLKVFRNFADGQQISKDFRIYFPVDKSLSVNMKSVKAVERSNQDVSDLI